LIRLHCPGVVERGVEAPVPLRIHKTLRAIPPMATGVSDHVWSMQEIAALAG